VTIEETWLYYYDSQTKQQSMEWRHSGSPSPNIPSARIRWKSSRLDFLGLARHPPIDYLPKGQAINVEHYLSLLVQLKDTLKEKHQPRESQQRGLVLARQCPGSPGTRNPEENGLPGLPVS